LTFSPIERFSLVGAVRGLHPVAGRIVDFGGLLRVHLQLDPVEEELQQVLVLGVATLAKKVIMSFGIGYCSPCLA